MLKESNHTDRNLSKFIDIVGEIKLHAYTSYLVFLEIQKSIKHHIVN